MTDVAELKQFAEVHLRRQKIPRYREFLDGIRSDGDGVPGSWVRQWCQAAEALERRGRFLDASRHYAMARFPYVNCQARQAAQDKCAITFDKWRRETRAGRDIERLNVSVQGGRIGCWATGLSTATARPLLVIMGGIVTVKEQWAAVLTKIKWLGMAGIVTEMPGVGENTVPYDTGCAGMLSAILDAVSDRADVTQTYMAALSFSGHLALRCAVDDSRIRGIVTVGAPVHQFFTDPGWQHQLPRITTSALAHMTRTDPGGLAGKLSSMAITARQLAELDIPVCYVASRRDEIIPAGDPRYLEEHLSRLCLIEYDDTHAAPHHIAETQLWTVLSLLRMRQLRNAQRAVFEALWHVQRGRSRAFGAL